MSPAPFPSNLASTASLSGLLRQRLISLQRLLGGVFGALSLVGLAFLPAPLPAIAPTLLANLFGAALMLAASFWLGRRGARAGAELAVADVATMLVATAVLGAVAASAPPALVSAFFLQHFTMLLLVLRAAIVPSRPARTALVGALSVGVATASVGLLSEATRWLGTGVTGRAGWLGFVAIGALTVAVTARVSRVMYGLHRQVREALRLGQYTLVEKIGEGGMGTVWRATHARLRRPTAVKLLAPGRADEASMARFDREAQLTSSLSHPNTVTVFDYGRTDEGTLYLVMELVAGQTLQQLVDQGGPLPPGRALGLLAQVAGSLGEAHELGLLHRDVKPANVLVGERAGTPDFVKVVDFGLAKAVAAGPAPDPLASAANVITGTPLYMAPEMVSAPEAIDARADIYAFGCLAYFMLTGRPVFEGGSMIELCACHLRSAPAPPSERLGRPLPARLEALVLRCLAKSPDDRPPTMRAVAAELAACAAELSAGGEAGPAPPR